jgi:UDP-glucose 4-epimerase
MNGETVLITGVAGFLGSYCAREFRNRGWRVVGIDIAVNGPEGVEYRQLALPDPALAGIVASTKPAACIHCAGRASVALSLSDPAADFRDGPALTFELLEVLRREAPECRTVLLSSAAVYGNPESLPVTEALQLAPLSPYGFHKLQCELIAEEFTRFFGLPTCAVRIFSAYGRGLRRQVVWDICERALKHGYLRLRGTGLESRDFIHAADVAAALALIVEKGGFGADRYNLASGVEITIRDLAAKLVEKLGLPVTPEFDGAETPGDPRNWRADISRVSALGFEQRIPLDDGLAEVAAWARAEVA